VAEKAEAQLNSEPRDVKWAAEAEADAAHTIERAGNDLTLASATCGATICKFELNHRASSERERDLEALAGSPPFDTTRFDYVRERNSSETIVYAMRSGASFPL